MTKAEMQNALATGFNKQGRTVSESMRVKYLAALTEPEIERRSVEYRGFVIEGRSGKYFVDSFPIVFPSVPQAQSQIDRCIEVREIMADEQI